MTPEEKQLLLIGGPITDEEWRNANIAKWAIGRENNCLVCQYTQLYYIFLAFHTKDQGDLFLEENEDLIKQYFML